MTNMPKPKTIEGYAVIENLELKYPLTVFETEEEAQKYALHRAALSLQQTFIYSIIHLTTPLPVKRKK